MILSINERQEPLWNGLHQSLAQLLVPVILSQSLFDHYPLDPSHSPAQNFVVFTGSFLSVCNPSLLGHLQVSVSELERDDPLDIWTRSNCVLPTISALQISGSFLISGANGVLKILTLTFIYVTTTPFYTLLYGLHVNRKSYETLWENALRMFTFLRVHPL